MLLHKAWYTINGGGLIERSTIVAEVDDDDYTQSLLHNQWNGGLNEHQSGSLPKKTLQTNGRTNMNIKIQNTKKWSQSMGMLGNGCVCNIEYQSTNI